jgi:hypothetical protein
MLIASINSPLYLVHGCFPAVILSVEVEVVYV